MTSDFAITLTEVSKDFLVRNNPANTFKLQMLGIFHSRFREKIRKFRVLDHINLHIKAGESVGLIGPNGSGKSTLLRMIAGIIMPTEGVIQVKGRIATLIELGAGFHPELTGKENIYFNTALYGLYRNETDRLIPDIVRFSGLEEYINVPFKNYSLGMQVRLAFAVAVYIDADILLIDEVFAVGDDRFQLKCFTRIQELRARGKTIIFVSHSLDSVSLMCDRAILLSEGRKISDGDLEQVALIYGKIDSTHLTIREQPKKLIKTTLLSAVSPNSRSVQVGKPATAFVTVINLGHKTALECHLVPTTPIPATFSFQITDPSTNKPLGPPNTPVDIPTGRSQTFLITFLPTCAFDSTLVGIGVKSTKAGTLPISVGVNTILLSASEKPGPDIVAYVDTPTNDGILYLERSKEVFIKEGKLSLVAGNQGETGTLRISADTSIAKLPVSVTLVEVDNATGRWLSEPSSMISRKILSNESCRFIVIVKGKVDISLDPSLNRIFFRFEDVEGKIRGETSVTVATK